MNIIRRLQHWRRQLRNKKRLQKLTQTFSALEKAESGGMLWFDGKSRRLFIEEPLAILLMQSARTWKNFMRNCHAWLHWQQCTEAWESYMLKEELKAVREAKRDGVVLTRRDVDRIRYARRQEISIEDMSTPEVAPFEFFVVSAKSSVKGRGVGGPSPAGEILCVGHYTPETGLVEMASWEEVKAFLG